MNVALPKSLNVDAFLAWVARREQGKYELMDGIVVNEQPQAWSHTRTRMQALLALREAINAVPDRYFVSPSGPTVRVGVNTAFAPDAMVAALPEPELTSLEIANPVIVVEVLSPSTARVDATIKLRGYFEVASVQHYLILDPEDGTVTHHKRGQGSALETRIASEGAITLDPPGLEIQLSSLFKPRP